MKRIAIVAAGLLLIALFSSTSLVAVGYSGARSMIELAAFDIEGVSQTAAVARTSVQVVIPPQAEELASVSPPEVTLVQQFVRQILAFFGVAQL